MKEQKQVRVYQWHSLVPYFNNSEPKSGQEPTPGLGPLVETKAAKKMVVFPKRPIAIHESISENSKYLLTANILLWVFSWVFSSKTFPKNLDPSYKLYLDFLRLFQKRKPHLIPEFYKNELNQTKIAADDNFLLLSFEENKA